MTVSIAVVIPTRNRAEFAMNAVRSLRAQEIPLEIFVSDNSTDPAPLRDFCRSQPNVHYLRPEAELFMGDHWDWALRTAMAQSSATHFSVHYDRRFSYPHAWGEIARAAAKDPATLLSFSMDFVSIFPRPRRLWQTPWTGRRFGVETARVAHLLANGQVFPASHGLPVLSNCLVPRAVVEAIVERFGDACNSTAPDGAFLCRFLSLHDRQIHLDMASGVLYGSIRSNGLGYLRGKGGDFPDFVKMWGDRAPWLEAAPVPGINLGSNMLFHEYELVRRATGDRLPPLDMQSALHDLGSELRWIADPDLRRALVARLRAHGWRGDEPSPFSRAGWRSQVGVRLGMMRFRWGGAVPPLISGIAACNDAQAVKLALRHGRPRQSSADHLAIFQPVELDSTT